MSGGHFDYAQYRIEGFADEIRDLIEISATSYSAETLEKFREASETLRRASKMLHRIDWLICDDDGEESFHANWEDLSADQGEELIDFEYWWSNIGSSQRPRADEDAGEFAKRMCEWAWEAAFQTYR